MIPFQAFSLSKHAAPSSCRFNYCCYVAVSQVESTGKTTTLRPNNARLASQPFAFVTLECYGYVGSALIKLLGFLFLSWYFPLVPYAFSVCSRACVSIRRHGCRARVTPASLHATLAAAPLTFTHTFARAIWRKLMVLRWCCHHLRYVGIAAAQAAARTLRNHACSQVSVVIQRLWF